MTTRPRFYSKLPFDKDKLNHKLGEITYMRAEFLVTARGEFMVAGPNSKGMSEVMFQYAGQTDSEWVRIYLGQKYVDRLSFPSNKKQPITCKDMLEDGLDLTTKMK